MGRAAIDTEVIVQEPVATEFKRLMAIGRREAISIGTLLRTLGELEARCDEYLPALIEDHDAILLNEYANQITLYCLRIADTTVSVLLKKCKNSITAEGVCHTIPRCNGAGCALIARKET